MRKTTTKRALLASALSLFLCFAMLLGTTFAWFTDSVTSANNIIVSGNLDIELEYWNDGEWVDVSGKSDILTNQLWEPGVTEVAYLRVANAGSLALKYQLGINIVSETAGVNKDGDPFKLSDYIQFGVVENVNGETGAYATREAAVAAVSESKKISAGYDKTTSMVAGEELYLALVVWMPTTVGNEANHNGTAPKIDLGINVFATQAASENDSFGDDYDKFSAAFTLEEANAMLAENVDVVMYGVEEPTRVLEIPADYTGTVALSNVALAGINKAASVRATDDVLNLVISGDVSVIATDAGASAISATEINISGDGHLTAVAKGLHAYGIGGENTESITITGVTIDYVAGGSVQKDFVSDLKYGKSEPEGGAAIGSGFDGAVITLNGVTIEKAEGGSKAAAIGARYHTGVVINITDSTIENAIGGNASAAIGGSRVSNGAAESGVTITIQNSNITALGGQFAAGIGSGYDTHCQATQPLCTINIEDSVINATGGKYGAGVGTGFHTAALAGEIKNSSVTAKSGDNFYKATYSIAMDIGFGIVDSAREGVQSDSKIVVNGMDVTMADAPVCVSGTTASDVICNLFAEGKVIYVAEDISLTPTDSGKYITVNGDVVLTGQAGAKVTFPTTTVFVGQGTVTVSNVSLVTPQELCVSGDSTLVINGGEHTLGAFSATSNGKIVVNGGTLNCKGTYAGVLGITFGENGQLIVNDGTLNMYQPFNLNPNRCDNAYVEINGGTIHLLNGADKLFVVRDVMDKDRASGTLRGSSIKITGGVFTTTYELDSDGDANAFIRNEDAPDTNRVLVSNAVDGYNCVVTGGTFYGCWQRADNNRLGTGGVLDNSIVGFVADGYEMTGDAVNGFVVTKQ